MKNIIENYSSVNTLTENSSVIEKLKVYSEELIKQFENETEKYTYEELENILKKVDHLESIGLGNSKNCRDLINKTIEIKNYIVKYKKQNIALENFITLKNNLLGHEIYLVSQENFSKLLGNEPVIIPLNSCEDEFEENEITFLSELHNFNPYEKLISYSQLSCHGIDEEEHRTGIIFLENVFTNIGNNKEVEYNVNQFAVFDFENAYPYDENRETLMDLVDNPSDYLKIIKSANKEEIFHAIQKKSRLEISPRTVYLNYKFVNVPLLATTNNMKILFNFLNGYVVVFKILKNI